MVPAKNVTEIFCDADADDRSDPYMSPPLKRAGDTTIVILMSQPKAEFESRDGMFIS